VYTNRQSQQTGSRNLIGPQTLPTIWGTYMKIVTKYQISAINSCWEKGDGQCAYMFNVYKNQLSRQTGSRNLTDPKTLPTIWYSYMTLVTKYQISAINSYWEICDEKYLGRTEGHIMCMHFTRYIINLNSDIFITTRTPFHITFVNIFFSEFVGVDFFSRA
jgi:hypothetical protein